MGDSNGGAASGSERDEPRARNNPLRAAEVGDSRRVGPGTGRSDRRPPAQSSDGEEERADMTERTGWMPALRWVLFAILLVNAVTLTVYFRIQEYRLKYKISRLQADLDKERERSRDFSRELLRTAQQENLETTRRDYQMGLRGGRD